MIAHQAELSFSIEHESHKTGRKYLPVLTINKNRKGVIDIDTVKGCSFGMAHYPDRGCYGECYACKIARARGFDFSISIVRRILDREHRDTLVRYLMEFSETWYRIGVMGDPSFDWNSTLTTINVLRHCHKIPVIVSKHWIPLGDNHISRLLNFSPIIHISMSPLDTDDEINYRVGEFVRLRSEGLNTVARVVTCKFGSSPWAKERNEIQKYLLSLPSVIDNPLRVGNKNRLVLNGDIIAEKRDESVGGGKWVSAHSNTVFLGLCASCPDQCGIDDECEPIIEEEGQMEKPKQELLFEKKVELIHVESVIGSGYEEDVARLALEDGIAHRAARKNMQIHSAIILLINDKFSGFFTFQNNHEVKEFCLLQSVIKPEHYTDELYLQMAAKVLECNTENYPALMTTNPKSKFETPKFYNSLGFQTYLAMSGFEYMVKGNLSDVRLKLLAHATMVNTWTTTTSVWLEIKKEWNATINAAGEKHQIPNPTLATREGCWQGESGFANVVTGHSHNKNASVLDPVACEVILRFFMPRDGKRVYNPFGGGVQFGFVCGYYGYEYIASEIRQNQCDANNKICSEFKNIQWIRADSATYEPYGMFDLVFSCPPYYRVEKYLDYDGKPPEGEINHLPTYDKFREALFSGYKIALDHLNNECFFVVMVGDSRDTKGAYHCSEAETELFLRDAGLSIYNKIVYLEGKFTRLAQAKKTLDMRKFPKCEQKIIVAFKGDVSNIKNLYEKIGRL